MSTYLSKYIKLSTQPWTGNGITNPTESLTLDGIDSSVTLSQSNSEFLINGLPVSSSGDGVTSLTVTPPLTSNGQTGNITLDLPSAAEGIYRVYQGSGIQINTPGGDVAMITLGGVTNVEEDGLNNTLNIQWPSQTGPMTIDTNTNIGSSPYSPEPITITNLPFDSPGISPPPYQGIYIIEISTSSFPFYISGIGRVMDGQFYVTGSFSVANQNVDSQDRIVIYTEMDEVSQLSLLYFSVGSTFGWPVGSVVQVAFYRIL